MGETMSTPKEPKPDYIFNILVLDRTEEIYNYIKNGPQPWIYEVDGKKIHAHFKAFVRYSASMETGSYSYYRGFDAIIFAQNYTKNRVDISKQWTKQIDRYASNNICKLFVGISNDDNSNKEADVQRTFQEYANAMGFQFMNISMSQEQWQRRPIIKTLDDVYSKRLQLQEQQEFTLSSSSSSSDFVSK